MTESWRIKALCAVDYSLCIFIHHASCDLLLLLLILQERLLHIPSWSWHGRANSDEVICISELKMSIMAQNCLAPGIVRLLANLIKPHRFKVPSFSVAVSDIVNIIMAKYMHRYKRSRQKRKLYTKNFKTWWKWKSTQYYINVFFSVFLDPETGLQWLQTFLFLCLLLFLGFLWFSDFRFPKALSFLNQL